MIANPSEQPIGARFIVLGAAAVVVVWGLHFLEPILLPFSLALFLSVLALPVLGTLCSRGVPNWFAVLISMSAVVGIFALFGFLASASFSDLQASLPRYQVGFQQLRAEWTVAIESSTALLEPGDVNIVLERLNLWDAGRFIEIAGSTIGRAASFVGRGLLVLLIMVFILAEAAVFPDKLEAIFGDGITGEERMRTVVVEVQQYLGIKTLVSLATGVLVGAWCWVMGLDFAVLLGMIAFGLNYIPTVGSIIAGVPAVVLSLIITGGSLAHAFIVAAGYIVVNTVFGNFIEPSLLGRRLGLSTLVVILSLVFWGWVWGPLGALLSVPLTMVVKIWLENTPDLRWIALLLDKHPRRLDEGTVAAVAAPPSAPSEPAGV